MKTTIKTKNHGQKTFWADARDSSSHVYLEDGPQHTGTLGHQITGNGGHTVTCDGTQTGLGKTARKWWANELRYIRKYEMFNQR